MATAGDIVTGALRYIQYQSAFEPVSAEDMAVGIEALNDMMASWSNEGIRVGYRAVSNTADYVTAPEMALLGMKQNLGVLIAPMFRTSDAPINPVLLAQAVDSKKVIKNQTITINDAPRPPVLPRGSGNHWYGDFRSEYYDEGDAIAQFELTGNTSAQSLTANTPEALSGLSWRVVTADGFTANVAGTASYRFSGIVAAHVKAQLLVKGSGSGYPGQVRVYVARNNDYIQSSGATVAIDSASDEKIAQIDFGPIGITKNDTIQLFVESTADEVLIVSGFMEIKQCA